MKINRHEIFFNLPNFEVSKIYHYTAAKKVNQSLLVGQKIFQRHFTRVRLQLHGAIYRPDSFVLMLRYCANFKAIGYDSTNLNRIVADKSHRVIVALV